MKVKHPNGIMKLKVSYIDLATREVKERIFEDFASYFDFMGFNNVEQIRCEII